jgi:hypothetical protein
MPSDQKAAIDWAQLVRAEYLEMPGLQLTKPQVRRLWGLEEETCDAVLAQLLATHVLKRTARDVYILDAAVC